jgi:protein-S-isoprenylcysteine O-methyltransferase Ste14
VTPGNVVVLLYWLGVSLVPALAGLPAMRHRGWNWVAVSAFLACHVVAFNVLIAGFLAVVFDGYREDFDSTPIQSAWLGCLLLLAGAAGLMLDWRLALRGRPRQR